MSGIPDESSATDRCCYCRLQNGQTNLVKGQLVAEINVRTASFLEPSSSDLSAATTAPEFHPLSAIFNTAGSGLNPATPGAVKLDPLSAIGNLGPGLPGTLAAAAHLDPLPAICNTGSGLNPVTLQGAAQLDPLLAISNTAESGLLPAIITLPGAAQIIDNPDSAICNTGVVQQQPCKQPVHIPTVPLRFKCSATRPPRAQRSSTFQVCTKIHDTICKPR